MEPENRQAPPVVAVVVVHEPGSWFEETLDALAEQDYPNLRFLFLTTGASPEIQSRIKVRLPDAFVRSMNANPGFGTAANEVLRLVEGDNGFFLFCHDDIAPEPDTVRTLVEEIFRSNAGAVGPKLVEWDDPGVLQSVGLGLDRFGEIDVAIEEGELDQEQHDGVRDVFVLPSACLLIRADLFREVNGFDPALSFYGDDIELCWRIHHSGARVIVAPAATVRHRANLAARRDDINHGLLEARHRMRAVVTLTGPTRLPARSIELVALTVVELIVGLFTGRFAQAWASLRGLIGLVPRTPTLVSRRSTIKALRRVPEREVLGLQVRGSARLSGFLRARQTATFVGAETSVRRWRESTTAPVIAWLGVLLALAVGSRGFISNGVPAVGEFLRFPESPRSLLDSFTSSWNPTSIGTTSPNPTGWGTLAGLSVFTLFRMGALQTVFVLGLVVLGLIGLWKLATVFPSTRARIGALVVYAASPLIVGAMSTGRLTTLIAYASVPWMVHTMRRAAGVATADPRSAELDVADGIVQLSWPERLRRVAGSALVVGLATAFVPVMVVVAAVIAVTLTVATLLALAPWRTALGYLGAGAAAVFGGFVVNFPWFTSWSWEQLVGPPPIGSPGRGLLDVASFQIGTSDFSVLSLALYLPVVAAIALARAWRLTWAVRAGMLVAVFGALAILADSDSLPFAAPEAGVLLAPVAVGLSIAAAAALAAFDLDVRGGSFGWRQPLGLLASVAVVVGVFPGAAAIADGSWGTPTTPLVSLYEKQFGEADAEGRYHVLLIGDARILPVPSTEYRDGISYAILDDGDLDIRDRWVAPSTDADESIRLALDEMASSSTLRAGRLLAPLGIRFVVAPEFDNVVSTPSEPLPLPGGLVEALEDQLDLTSQIGVTLEVFENTSWLPTFGLLTDGTAEASRTAGPEALVRADLTSVRPLFDGADQFSSITEEISAGVVHLAFPFDDRWELTVNGERLEPRRAFGVTTAFDVEQPGTAELVYRTSSTRSLLLFVQVALWLIALFGATRVSVPLTRRRNPLIADETLIDFSNDLERPLVDPGLDVTGGIDRAAVDGTDALDADSDANDEVTGTASAVAVETSAVDVDVEPHWSDDPEPAEAGPTTNTPNDIAITEGDDVS